MNLAEQIFDDIDEFLAEGCNDSCGITNYVERRTEKIKNILALIEDRERKAAEKFAEKLKKVSMYCIDGMSITKEENEQLYDNGWKCPNLDEFIDQILNELKAVDNDTNDKNTTSRHNKDNG